MCSVLPTRTFPNGLASVHGRIISALATYPGILGGVLGNDRSRLKPKVLVPGGGVEPPRAEARRILSPLRLPVPPSRHGISRAEKFSLIDRVGLCNRAGPTLRLWPLSGSEGLSVATRRNRRSRCLRCGSRLVAEGCRRSCCDIRFCNERRWAGRDRSRGEKL